MTDERFEQFERVDPDIDLKESDEWVLVGHFLENDVPIYYHPNDPTARVGGRRGRDGVIAGL